MSDIRTKPIVGNGALAPNRKTRETDRRGASKGDWGQKPYERTEDHAQIAKRLAFRMPYSLIALKFGISEKTLVRHYRDELTEGSLAGVEAITGLVYNRALNGDHKAQTYLLDTRGGFRRRNLSDELDQDAHKASANAPTMSFDPSVIADFSEAEFALYERLCEDPACITSFTEADFAIYGRICVKLSPPRRDGDSGPDRLGSGADDPGDEEA